MRRANLIGELAVVLILVKVYDWVRSLEATRAGPALRHAEHLLAVERWLHLDVELASTHWLASRPAISLVAAYWYQFAHLSVTLTVLAWCWWSRPDRYRRARNALVLTNVTGLLVFLFLPMMPPRLLPGAGYVDAAAAAGFGPPHAGPVAADQYAAMPSLHLAWATWTAAVALSMLAGRRGARLVFLYPAVTAVVVVVTGNHYVLDVVAGVAVAVLALLAADRIPSPLPRPWPVPALGWASGFGRARTGR